MYLWTNRRVIIIYHVMTYYMDGVRNVAAHAPSLFGDLASVITKIAYVPGKLYFNLFKYFSISSHEYSSAEIRIILKLVKYNSHCK